MRRIQVSGWFSKFTSSMTSVDDALKTDDSLSVRLTCWELQVGQYIMRAERQYEHVSYCCQIRALHLPNLICLCINFWP